MPRARDRVTSPVITPTDCIACNRKLCRFLNRDLPGQVSRIMTLERGERLQTPGGDQMRFWVVVKGSAAICVGLPDGRRQISGIETVGDTLCGPMAATDNANWIEALEPTEICELDFSRQGAELRADPAFLSAMFAVIHRRLEETSRHLTTLGRLDSTERVILFLAEMAMRKGGNHPVHLTMNREDIADYLGLNAETVSRIFTRLKKSGLFLFTSPTDYRMSDPDAVRRRLPVPIPDRPRNHLDPTRQSDDTKREKAG